MPLQTEELIRFLNKLEPFNLLSEEVCREIARSSTLKKFSAKETIFFEGSSGESGYLVYSGRVAMVKSSGCGREMIVELLPAGEAFGIIVFIHDRPYPLTARAQNNCEILLIPKSIITKIAQNNPEISNSILKIVSSRLASSHNVSRSIAHDRVEVRIAATLCAIISRLSTGTDDPIDIGRQEIADIVGTTIETASRVCKQLEKDKILDLTTVGKVGIRDLAALQQIVGNANN